MSWRSRVVGIVIAGAMVVAGGPAFAGIRATYVSEFPKGSPGDPAMTITMTIAVDDAGNDRTDVKLNGELIGSVVYRDRDTYIVQRDSKGWVVMRQADAMAAAREQMIDSLARMAVRPDALPRRIYNIVDLGSATVGGRIGERYGLRAIDDKQTGEPFFQFVISPDQALAPLGRIMMRQMSASGDAMAGLMPSDLPDRMVELLSKGAMLSIGDMLSLDTVETADIPESTFDLPGPVLSLAQVRARVARPVPTISLPAPPARKS